jgi:light-regulated signal transduction histidine kinase (bacteriophytochrome)
MSIDVVTREPEEQFRLAAETSPFATMLVSLSTGEIISANAAFSSLGGETVWKNPQSLTDLIAVARENGQASAELDLAAGGTVLAAARAHLDQDFISILFADISQQKATEAELRQKVEHLSNSNAELEQFAYIASHDLQEPLRMVNGYMQLLKQRYEGNLDKDADEFIGFAVDGATRMQQMINDLLVFSRVQTRGKDIVSTDPNQALQNAIENLEMAIEDAGVDITRTRMPAVLADATQLTMLFQNLLSNAIKFRNTSEPPKISITSTGNDASLTVCVEDNGIGIDAQFFEKIFAIFRKLHTRDEYPGTGIGLAVAKRIVARHSGRIWVESTLGGGSRFYFTLAKPQGE